ncbi:MAG: NADP-dependent malic enzyme [Candidatus Nitrosocosmicus sp.]|nr:NADP-dependent malic enzyme [Candidatus Nitrosocosmicus sp.]MDN5866198.1 NADP-dependent malic enzyme [Candidatus Nitrosocosmicus sp.]
MNTKKDEAINLHKMLKGKIEIHNKVSIENIFDEENGTLGLIYTPGVAYVATAIKDNKELAYDYTSKWNNVAIICDGTRVLGLGNIGPEGALPVMEGKSVLFKILGGINAFPLCIATKEKEEIIRFVKEIEPVFGAINIEDIESPKVFDIIKRLQNEISIPVFHDDQHGTAVITLAALINSLTLLNKKIDSIKVAISGAGSAGYGIFKILKKAGCKDIIVIDSKGAIYEGREDIAGQDNGDAVGGVGRGAKSGGGDDISTKSSNSSNNTTSKYEISRNSNPRNLRGNLADVIKGADVFIGVSGRAGLLTAEMVNSMNQDAIIFALSNPDPEILPPDALNAGARIAATGRSDFPNQINNAVVFPSVLRALLDTRAKGLDEDMLVAASYAIASLVERPHLKEDYIIPKINDPRILSTVVKTLKEAIKSSQNSKIGKKRIRCGRG